MSAEKNSNLDRALKELFAPTAQALVREIDSGRGIVVISPDSTTTRYVTDELLYQAEVVKGLELVSSEGEWRDILDSVEAGVDVNKTRVIGFAPKFRGYTDKETIQLLRAGADKGVTPILFETATRLTTQAQRREAAQVKVDLASKVGLTLVPYSLRRQSLNSANVIRLLEMDQVRREADFGDVTDPAKDGLRDAHTLKVLADRAEFGGFIGVRDYKFWLNRLEEQASPVANLRGQELRQAAELVFYQNLVSKIEDLPPQSRRRRELSAGYLRHLSKRTELLDQLQLIFVEDIVSDTEDLSKRVGNNMSLHVSNGPSFGSKAKLLSLMEAEGYFSTPYLRGVLMDILPEYD